MGAATLQVDAVPRLPARRRSMPDFLTPPEIDLRTGRRTGPLGLNRAWEYRCQRVGAGQ